MAKYPDSIKQFQRNDAVIMDRLEENEVQNRRKVSSQGNMDKLMSLFTSRCSEKTEESP